MHMYRNGVKHINALTDKSKAGSEIPTLSIRLGESWSTCERRRARIHPAGWNGERHLSLPDVLSTVSCSEQGAQTRREPADGTAHLQESVCLCRGLSKSPDWILHRVFPYSFLVSVWKVKCGGEEKRTSFLQTQSTMCVSLTVPALSSALLPSASLCHHHVTDLLWHFGYCQKWLSL